MIDFLILATLWFFGIIVPLGGLILIVRKVIVPYWVKGWSSQWVFWYILGGCSPVLLHLLQGLGMDRGVEWSRSLKEQLT